MHFITIKKKINEWINSQIMIYIKHTEVILRAIKYLIDM